MNKSRQLKKFKVSWDESIIYHMTAIVEATSKKEIVKLVKDLQVYGHSDGGEDFEKIIQKSIIVTPV